MNQRITNLEYNWTNRFEKQLKDFIHDIFLEAETFKFRNNHNDNPKSACMYINNK